ncbi:MAG: hypothetical protein KDA58_06020 [Planctomycetaceae bacterium]|nr:hypothetical protein [Planctomycetaceae bacterium]
MFQPAKCLKVLLLTAACSLPTASAQAGVIPWVYDAIFGYHGPAWGGRYMGGYPAYGWGGYGGYASYGYAPSYSVGYGYAPGYVGGYGASAGCGGCGTGYSVSANYGWSGYGCGCATPCGCSPCSGGCSTGDCGVTNYAPAATDDPQPTTSGTPSTFRKKELPTDEFTPVTPGSDFRPGTPTERDGTNARGWSGTNNGTPAGSGSNPADIGSGGIGNGGIGSGGAGSGITPGGFGTGNEVVPGNFGNGGSAPAGTGNEVVPGIDLLSPRPAPGEPAARDLLNETNEVVPSGVPGASNDVESPAEPHLAGTQFVPNRARLVLHADHVLPQIARLRLQPETVGVDTQVAGK